MFKQYSDAETPAGEGGPPWRLLGLIAVAVVLGVICVWLYVDYLQPPAGGAHLDKVMVLKCLNPQCGKVERYTLAQVRAMIRGPNLSSPAVLDCEQCGQRALTQAVECPACGEVFVVWPTRQGSDNCPNCGASYSAELRRKQAHETQDP